MKSRRSHSNVSAAAVLLVLVVAFYWKLSFTRQFDWMWNFDLAQQVLPWFEVQARQWHSGIFPLWDESLWYGQPLLDQAQPGAAYPLNWILFLLPLRNGHISDAYLQWYFILTRYLAALFTFLLCRDLKCSRSGSILAGLVFGLGGYIGFNGWPALVNGASWAPVVFLFLLRVVRGHRVFAGAALSGSALGVCFLAGHHQIPMFCALAVAAVWVYLVLREPTGANGRSCWPASPWLSCS